MTECDHYAAKPLTRMGDMQCGKCGMVYLIEIGGNRWADRPEMKRAKTPATSGG